MYYFVYHFQVFLLIMMRMSAMIAVAPFFSSDVIPFRIKALLAFMVTLVIFPMITAKGYRIPGDMGGYFLMVMREVAIGLFIGFLVSVIFASFQLAGQYFAVQIGFGINEVLDPVAQVSVPLVGQYKNLIGLLVLLAMNGHHMMIQGVYRSYELAPLLSVDKAYMSAMLKSVVHHALEHGAHIGLVDAEKRRELIGSVHTLYHHVVAVHGQKNEKADKVLVLAHKRHAHLRHRVEHLIDAEAYLHGEVLPRELKGGEDHRNQKTDEQADGDLPHHHQEVPAHIARDAVPLRRDHGKDDQCHHKGEKRLYAKGDHVAREERRDRDHGAHPHHDEEKHLKVVHEIVHQSPPYGPTANCPPAAS